MAQPGDAVGDRILMTTYISVYTVRTN